MGVISVRGLLALLKLGDVEFLVYDLWYWLDLCVQLLLDGDQIEAVVVSDKVDSETEVTKTT